MSDDVIDRWYRRREEIGRLLAETPSQPLYKSRPSTPNLEPKTGDEFHQAILSVCWNRSKMHLHEREEFARVDGAIEMRVLIGKEEIIRKLFVLFLMAYAYEVRGFNQDADEHRYGYVGVDYEFHNRVIALMQIHFDRGYDCQNPANFIWLIDPKTLPDDDHAMMVKLLMRNKQLFKILHGADSLDIPYMFNEMFKGDRDTILDFTARLIDTRFICEFLLATTGEPQKCAIYEALLRFGTIDQKKHTELHQTHTDMGPIENITWDINTLTIHYLRYAVYDVVYLKRYLFDLYQEAKRKTPKYYPFYRYLTRLTQYVILERRGATSITKEFKAEIDPMNNYLVYGKRKRATLISIYNSAVIGLALPEIGMYYDKVMMINYFRSQISILFKRLVYGIVVQRWPVFEKRDVKYTGTIDVRGVYRRLETDRYKFLVEILEKFAPILEQRIRSTIDFS